MGKNKGQEFNVVVSNESSNGNGVVVTDGDGGDGNDDVVENRKIKVVLQSKI